MKQLITLILIALFANFFLQNQAIGQIGQRGGATSGTNSGTSISVNIPTGVVAGDVLIATIAQNDNGGGTNLNVNASAGGWTLIDGRQIGISGNNEWWGTVLYRIADGSEGASVSFSLDGDADGGVASIVAFYGVNTTGGVTETGAAGGPFDLDPGILNNINSDNTLNASSITTASAQAAVLMLGVIGDNNNVDDNSWTTATAGDLTELFDNSTGNGADNAVTGAWLTLAAAGPTGAGSADISASDPNGSILIALKPIIVNAGADQLVNGTSVSLSGSTTAGGTPVYSWTRTGGPAGPTITSPSNSATTVTGLVSGNTYTFRLTVNGGAFDEVQVRVITGSNLWATSVDGTQIASFSTNGAAAIGGPTTMFAPSFAGATNTYSRTAALGRTDKPSQTAGYFYYLGTSSGGNDNNGLVEVWASSAAGVGTVRVGSFDFNGGSGTELGFVRLGMGPDGTGWILAGDGTTLYLAKFTPNGVNPVTITIEDASVTLVDGIVADFVNGDICLDGNGRLVALANNGSGVTQIFTGDATGATTTLTKKWDLVDGDNANAPFTGSVNGVAFEKATSNSGLYISTSDGLYYINSTQASTAFGTIPCTVVWTGTGLQDLASNFFPNTIITPVSMSSFSVNKQGTNAMLSWTTVTEINTDHFEIERSFDGISFSKVGSKAAAGNSTDQLNYQFADPIGSLSASVIYYRIRTVDQDGKVSYSNIVALRVGGTVKGFNVYPNPFVNDLRIELDAAKAGAVTVRISNAAGQMVYNRSSMVQKGNNVLVIASELSALQRGTYFIELISEDGKQSQKLIKR
jgi:Secretion system C-terminal sorting domain